jgi:hypothetical protein
MNWKGLILLSTWGDVIDWWMRITLYTCKFDFELQL